MACFVIAEDRVRFLSLLAPCEASIAATAMSCHNGMDTEPMLSYRLQTDTAH